MKYAHEGIRSELVEEQDHRPDFRVVQSGRECSLIVSNDLITGMIMVLHARSIVKGDHTTYFHPGSTICRIRVRELRRPLLIRRWLLAECRRGYVEVPSDPERTGSEATGSAESDFLLAGCT
jgi:hypothetical protein